MLDFGNERNAAIRALIANNDNVEAAMNWIFDNQDQDLSAPIKEDN